MSAKRIPELDMAIKWKTFFEYLSQRAFRDEMDKGVVAAIFCLSKYPASMDTVVRWKALCDILGRDPFKVDIPRRGIIAALILVAVSKN